jgi:hypothetical protein
MVTRASLVIALGLAGCTSFQDPNVVVDLRVLALDADPPDQVLTVDVNAPPDPVALLGQLAPTQVCALVADPGTDRRLAWSIAICPFGTNAATGDRCSDPKQRVAIAQGTIDDPDTTVPEPALCATVAPNNALLGVLINAISADKLSGLGGIDYDLELTINGEGAADADAVVASKTLRVLPRIPDTVTPNHNPTIDHIDMSIAGAAPTPLPLVRCAENPSPPVVPLATKVRLTPVEPDGARETYVAPTLDGKGQTFTETFTYQWTASAGGFSKGTSGGPHQLSGTPAPLFTDFKTPAASDLKAKGSTDISLWIVQRDERLGVHWYEACVRTNSP